MELFTITLNQSTLRIVSGQLFTMEVSTTEPSDIYKPLKSSMNIISKT